MSLSKFIRTALFVSAVLSLTLAGGRAQKSSATKRLLFLYWYDRDYPANVRFDQSFRAALGSAAHGTIDFYAEYLETNRFPGENQSRVLRDYLRQKYADLPIDVLVANTPPALDFFLKYRSDLFPHAPIVFATTEFPSAEQLALGPGSTGVVYLKTHRETLDLALKLHPDTEQVFIVSGANPIDTTGRKDLQGYSGKVAINYLTDLPLGELVVRVKSLPERSLVLYVRQQLSDPLGKFLESRDVLALIARSARVPIYGMVEPNVGLGIVGGYVFTTDANAAKLAELAVRVANGARPADIPVQRAPSVPMFDWRQLQRWNIPENRLPPGSIIRFRELTMWEQYKWRIVGTITIVMLQALLIGSLLVQRKRAQRRAVALVEAQRVVQESEERFRRVFEEGPLGVALVGKDYRFLKANNALCQMVEYDEMELLQLSFVEITHPDDVRTDVYLAEQLFKREIPFYRIQKRYVKKSGEIIWINLTASMIVGSKGEPLHGLAMIEDITEAKRTQEEALVRQKLESVGTLAGGIAHDFNNLLGAIQAQAELAMTEMEAGASCREELKAIGDVAMRGAEIVRELMIYAGKENTVTGQIDLSKTVDEMLSLLKVSVTKRALIQTDLQDDLPAIQASVAQIGQIVMNLITNASDAIEDRDGVIRVMTRHVTLQAKSVANLSSMLADGDYVQLEVSDTGRGMSPQTRAKVFDPFFTTKSAGRGLGLAVVHGIVRNLGGAIHLTSELDKGTTVQVLLPCAEARAGSSGPAMSAVRELAAPSQHGTILVVEDEHQLRQAVVKMLRKTGCEVFEAADGSSAIDILRADGDKIDVMLLDMTIPGASSHEVVAEAASAKPDIRIILTSAYSHETMAGAMSPPQIRSFIRKPFQFGDLLNTLWSSLPRTTCQTADGRIDENRPIR